MLRLVELSRPFIDMDPAIKGRDLAIRMIEARVGIQEIFGRYQIRDFTAAANRIMGRSAGRTPRAKTE